jgi:hypothetical protein
MTKLQAQMHSKEWCAFKVSHGSSRLNLKLRKILHEGNLHMTLLSTDRPKLMTRLKPRNTATWWLMTIPLIINQSSNQYFLMKIWIQTIIKMTLRFHFELHFKTVHKECLSSQWPLLGRLFQLFCKWTTEGEDTDVPQNVGLLATEPPDVAAIPFYWLFIWIPLNLPDGALHSTLHHTFNSRPIWLTTRWWEEWSHSKVVAYLY